MVYYESNLTSIVLQEPRYVRCEFVDDLPYNKICDNYVLLIIDLMDHCYGLNLMMLLGE